MYSSNRQRQKKHDHRTQNEDSGFGNEAETMQEEYQKLCSTIEAVVNRISVLQEEKNNTLQRLFDLDAELMQYGNHLLALTNRRDEQTKMIAKNLLLRFQKECQRALNVC